MSGGVKQFGELFQLVTKKYESDYRRPEPRNAKARIVRRVVLFKFTQAHQLSGVLFSCKPF